MDWLKKLSKFLRAV